MILTTQWKAAQDLWKHAAIFKLEKFLKTLKTTISCGWKKGDESNMSYIIVGNLPWGRFTAVCIDLNQQSNILFP